MIEFVRPSSGAGLKESRPGQARRMDDAGRDSKSCIIHKEYKFEWMYANMSMFLKIKLEEVTATTGQRLLLPLLLLLLESSKN